MTQYRKSVSKTVKSKTKDIAKTTDNSNSYRDSTDTVIVSIDNDKVTTHFFLSYILSCRILDIATPETETVMNTYFRSLRQDKGFTESKLLYHIRKVMSKIKLGIETHRLTKRVQMMKEDLW